MKTLSNLYLKDATSLGATQLKSIKGGYAASSSNPCSGLPKDQCSGSCKATSDLGTVEGHCGWVSAKSSCVCVGIIVGTPTPGQTSHTHYL